MNPVEIRELTEHMLERSWTEVAGLRISNGTTALGPHILPTHRWMLEGVAGMIGKFAESLPDMDLAFNTNDENRVAVLWDVMEDLRARAKLSRGRLNGTKTLHSFTTNILKFWRGSFMEPEAPYPADVSSEYFTDASFMPSFDQYGVVGCSPDSPSRKYCTSGGTRSLSAMSVQLHTLLDTYWLIGLFLDPYVTNPTSQTYMAFTFHLRPSNPLDISCPSFLNPKFQYSATLYFRHRGTTWIRQYTMPAETCHIPRNIVPFSGAVQHQKDTQSAAPGKACNVNASSTC